MTTAIPFRDVVSGPDQLMGVKAVWGRSRESVMCFGSRGDPGLKDKKHFQLARVTAEYAQTQPYLVSIGGGQQVTDELRGRVVELLRITGAYGEMSAFVKDEELRARLAQWPVAVIPSEIYMVIGEPLLVEDLDFPDRRILENAYDSVRRDDAHIRKLWEALKDREVVRRWDIQLPPGFKDPGKVQICSSMIPKASAAEGKKAWDLSLAIERDSGLRPLAKASNRAKNGGQIVCEACGFADDLSAMFDAHHLRPLAAGERESRVDDLAVLCPTYHRTAHWNSHRKSDPLTVLQVRAIILQDRA